MKIISPIDNLAETEALLQAGADEFYGGFVPANWQECFSLLTSINQRTFDSAQIGSRDELVAIIGRIHNAGRTFSLTLNAPFYTDDQLPLLLEYVADAVVAGIDGIILADIALVRTLRANFPDLQLHASTLAHLGNSLSAALFADGGVERLIFPRHLPVSEMAEIVQACPGVAFDAFLLVGKCPNTEGLCTFHHSSADKIWPCEIPYTITPESEPASAATQAAMEQQRSWSKTNRRHGCGLCAIPHLRHAGLSGVKLVGRGAPALQKVRNIMLVKEFIALAGQTADFASYQKTAVAAHAARFGVGCSPNVCYYPEFYLAE